MSHPSFTLIKQHVYRQSLAIAGSAALVLLLAAALALGVQHVLAQERANLSADFAASVAYIAEQEQFLRKMQAQNRQGRFGRLARLPEGATPAGITQADITQAGGGGYSLIAPAGQAARARVVAEHLTNYYTLFWAYSHFPSASLLAFDAAGTVQFSIPALTDSPTRLGSGAMDAALFAAVMAAAQPLMTSEAASPREPVRLKPDTPHWRALPGEPRRMVALLAAQLPAQLPEPLLAAPPAQLVADAPTQAAPASATPLPALWLASVMSRARLQAQAEAAVLDQHQFWLANAAGETLLGETAIPHLADGFSLTAHGLALCLRADMDKASAGWRGCYRIGYGSFLGDKLWLPVAALLLVLLGVLGARGYWRWFQRQVIAPAQHSQQALAAANEAKSTFLATMSHELRTPLYGVLGTLELLARTRLDEVQQQHVARMQGAALLLQQQISDVLDVRSIEAGQMALSLAPFNLPELVRATTNAYADLASRQGLDLHCDIAPGLPEWVQGDAARLRQILANLLSNALKFTRTGAVRVRVACIGHVTEVCTVRLEVMDTGPGMTAEQRARLFTPGQASCQPDGMRGAGLGLSICQHIAQLMASRIEVESVVGQGTRFWLEVSLPLAARPASAANSAQATDAAVETATDTATDIATDTEPLGLHVLVAEDNPINQATLTHQLEALGCTRVLVGDGEAALAAWVRAQADAGRQFDALLTDINMPRLDGYALARALRARGVTQAIIGISANALAGEEGRCLAAGMSARLVKPLSLEALARCLRAHCAPVTREPEPAAVSASEPPAPERAEAGTPTPDLCGPEIPRQYRALFHDTMRADLAHWQAHQAARDAAALAQTLHRIRGGLVVVGQRALADTLSQFESQLTEGGLEALELAALQQAQSTLHTLIEATAPAHS